jgi:hypothetical protein
MAARAPSAPVLIWVKKAAWRPAQGKDLFDFIWFGVRLAGPEKYCLFYV